MLYKSRASLIFTLLVLIFSLAACGGTSEPPVNSSPTPVDEVKPIITLIGTAEVSLVKGDTYTEQGATATDDVDGNISASVVISGDQVDTSILGNYKVIYNVSDAAGNQAMPLERVVNVVASNQLIEVAVGEQFQQQVPSNFSAATYTLVMDKNVDGLTINSTTGVLYWTPTPDQIGAITLTVIQKDKASNNNATTTLDLMVIDSPLSVGLSKALFFSPNGKAYPNATGRYDDPLSTDTTELCRNGSNNKIFLNGKQFYFRGGTYFNPNYGKGKNNNSIAKIKCSGVKGKPLLITPWGNESAKIKFDSQYGLIILGDYIHLDGMEIEGITQDIDYAEAVENWWGNLRYYNGAALSYAGIGIQIINNVFHDMPGAGINTRGKEVVDDLLIENNIIFNASWWNVGGTTALGIVGANQTTSDKITAREKGIVIQNNLVFSSESRIFSHVFSKGFTHLTIDEGSSMLLKQAKGKYIGSYDKGFLVKNNFFLFNGKGVSLRWRDINIINNTFYHNGATLLGGAGGVRSNGGLELTIKNNAIYTFARMNAVDFSPTVTLTECINNVYYPKVSNAQSCTSGSNQIIENMYKDPTNNDFTSLINNNTGAPMAVFSRLKTKLLSMGYDIKPANYTRIIDGVARGVATPEYIEAHQLDVVSYIPSEALTIEKVDFKGTGGVNDYKITFPDDTNVTGNEVFYLEID